MACSGDAKSQDNRDYLAVAARRYGLTPRMTRLARLLFEGASIEEAAYRLGRSVGTVKACGHDIYMATDSHSRVEFVKTVYEAWIDDQLTDRAADSS